jgi:hypothetical protein
MRSDTQVCRGGSKTKPLGLDAESDAVSPGNLLGASEQTLLPVGGADKNFICPGPGSMIKKI